jgi:serine/threonine protein phosphatase PrpC
MFLFCLQEDKAIPAPYFAIFDGHAGTGASLMAANLLHKHIEVSFQIVNCKV